MTFVVAGLLAALRPSGERIAGASYPLAAILIGAATGLTIYNGRHAVSRRLDDIQVLTLHSTSRLSLASTFFMPHASSTCVFHNGMCRAKSRTRVSPPLLAASPPPPCLALWTSYPAGVSPPFPSLFTA